MEDELMALFKWQELQQRVLLFEQQLNQLKSFLWFDFLPFADNLCICYLRYLSFAYKNSNI